MKKKLKKIKVQKNFPETKPLFHLILFRYLILLNFSLISP